MTIAVVSLRRRLFIWTVLRCLVVCDALQGTQYNQLLTGMSERLASAAVESQRQLPIFVGNGVCNPRAIEGRARAGRVADEIGDLGAQAGLPARRGGSGPSQEARRSIGDSTSSNDAARFGFQPRRSGDRRVATANAAAFSKLRRLKRRTSVSTPVGAATQRAPLNARDQTADSICAAADREPFGGKDADISKCLHIEFTRQKRCAAKAQAEMRGETNHQVTHGKPSLGP